MDFYNFIYKSILIHFHFFKKEEVVFTNYLTRHNFICKKKLIKKKNKDLNPLFLKNTFNPILIKEKNSFKKNIFGQFY